MTTMHISHEQQEIFAQEVEEFLKEVAARLTGQLSVLDRKPLSFRACVENLAIPEYKTKGILVDPDNALYRRFLIQVYAGDMLGYFPDPVPPEAVRSDGWCDVFRYVCHLVFQKNRTDRTVLLQEYIPTLLPRYVLVDVLRMSKDFSAVMFGCHRRKFVYETHQ